MFKRLNRLICRIFGHKYFPSLLVSIPIKDRGHRYMCVRCDRWMCELEPETSKGVSK